ncbi:hypothetical protein KUTeg_000380 [Tegillarca granosa]|uniref:Dynein regulatory complex protein 1/2 N-terminal domain-containing protein n=1 Tax=Tegillarca granosa TaxID=220873 RepID=A0ABQ9FXD1_TEGGR|nr:hypothetical protein KUTeg_000380 [Tegillarca granosa]
MSSSGEEEDVGPSVDSENPEERIAARRMRIQRRIEAQKRKERLEQEAKLGAEKFEDITKKWESALQKEIPQSLHQMLRQQKTSCDTILADKNKLINDFQSELKTKDDQYIKDLKQQEKDIDLMIERMEEQIKNLTKAYTHEMNQIEKAFQSERDELLEQHKKKWEEKMESRRQKEIEYMKAREKRVEDYEHQIHNIRVQDAEEYNLIKIRLETDVQILEQQLQQMRATYQLNQEKMQDALNGLRIKLAKQEKQYRDENQSLTEDYKRITEQFRDLQRKSHHFMQADSKKFHDVWCMNEEDCKERIHNIMEADRIIHEQQLGLQWNQPDIVFAENEGPLMSDDGKKGGLSATQLVQEVLSQTGGSQAGGDDQEGEEDRESIPADRQPQKSTLLSKISATVIKSILELLCDESALGIDTEEDVHILASYFMHVKGKKQAQPDEEEVDEKSETEMSGDMVNETLTSRSSLINETDALRQQNAELRMLLHQYVNSKVNAELEIPPTRVLQLEMNPRA